MSGEGGAFGQRPAGPGVGQAASRRWPLWPVFVAAMIPAYLLQLIPLLNLLLLFALSPLWICVLMHAALATLVMDVRRGATPRWLLAIPILVYGGTLAWSIGGFVNYLILDARLTGQNAALRLPFDPTRTSLVAPAHLAEDLVKTYALPTTWTADDAVSTTQRPGSLRILPPAACQTIPLASEMRTTSGFGGRGKIVHGGCLLRLSGEPEGPVLRATYDPPPEKGMSDRTRVTLTTPEGASATLVYGRAQIVLPVPIPIVGCITWYDRQCSAYLVHLKPAVGGKVGDVPRLVAAVLGLKPRKTGPTTIKGRRVLALDPAQTEALAVGSGAAAAEARAVRPMAVARSLERFTRLMAGEDLASDADFDRWLVVSNADRVDAEALLAAIRRVHGDKTRSDAQRAFGAVAAALPAQAFAAIGPRLAPLVADDEVLAGADGLAVRLGDLGAPAAAPLAARIEAGRAIPGRTDALLGLCRAGPAAASVADRIAAISRDDARADVIEAAVLALLRMGRRDLAQPLAALPATNGFNGSARRGYRKEIERILAEVHPGSPRSVCQLDRDERLPRVPWLIGSD